jgi:hypothetical protein
MSTEKRMYVLVPYQLTGIQKGIQALHAVVEYQTMLGHYPIYKEWATEWKTVILLDGGTTNDGKIGLYGHEPFMGTLNESVQILRTNHIQCATFQEPDLQNALTGVAFICDEKVFDKTIPTFKNYVRPFEKHAIYDEEKFHKQYLEEFELTAAEDFLIQFARSFRLA